MVVTDFSVTMVSMETESMPSFVAGGVASGAVAAVSKVYVGMGSSVAVMAASTAGAVSITASA